MVAVLGDWADDLKADGVTLPALAKTRQHHRAIQAKAEDKAQESRKKMGDLAGKTAGKIAETTAGAAVGAVIGSFVPVIGPIGACWAGWAPRRWWIGCAAKVLPKLTLTSFSTPLRS